MSLFGWDKTFSSLYLCVKVANDREIRVFFSDKREIRGYRR